MKIAIVCKSDSTGGAAIVSRRLTEAFRERGIDARMLVLEKLSNAPYVTKVTYPLLKPLSFLMERLQVWLCNGLSRANLFKVDTGSFGLPLWRQSVIREADVVILNWVNQGMLSLKGVRKMTRPGKKVIWTMHDMWNITGICHHSLGCKRFMEECGDCPFLHKGNDTKGHSHDLSHKIWKRKRKLYDETAIKFVAVSSWLAGEAKKSTLLGALPVAVIPNPFKAAKHENEKTDETDKKRILFAASHLDNWIKGLDTFTMALSFLKEKHPEFTGKIAIDFAGVCRNQESLKNLPYPSHYLGVLNGESELASAYSQADVVVNTSSFENLPGTLVEAQAYGAVPVAFDRGGQKDIIEHLSTGYLAHWDDDTAIRAANIAEGIAWALLKSDGMREKMMQNVEQRFSYKAVTDRYLELIRTIE